MNVLPLQQKERSHVGGGHTSKALTLKSGEQIINKIDPKG